MLAAIADVLDEGQMLMTGAVRAEAAPGSRDGERYYNSVLTIGDTGEIVDAVDKLHLVPFGEYLPFADLLARVGLEQLVAGPMNFVAGSERHALVLPDGTSALPFVCYEIIFPDLLPPNGGLPVPDLLVNVTNDAWFGDTPGPYQHFRQAQVRAVESGLPLVRAANNGISGVIDPRGRVVDALAMNVRGVIDVLVPITGLATTKIGGLPKVSPSLAGFAVLFLLAASACLIQLRQRYRVN